MGGHDAHHHGPPYQIPNHDIYKVEDVPELKRVQEELAKKGLRDPWLRNQVWRYKRSASPYMRALITVTRGWRIGVPAFLITIAIEQYFGIDYSGHGHHKDKHGNDHH
ncbi:NADH dehydrogenase [ubiquinone] 1 beta subcomplex subunit 3 [Trachymyrmex septentrionalis]|uniref:NADH dehydrogenase [ubiquinone] 1 beta subcomplex subunit 3 n=1 Tax=Trachymyrmex septentrionalis TaxID=34720 RepID=A0A195FXN7_9HYME|nr:PREDICTED: NADH dehydrogenase [ubiquinone] 1 beta subcomplex subunit 3 [Trachymyrmex septentrionalis]KYN45198.1 NADH dehydrogenase [ubiquinone] 1 beta subcomplex subunit 3 [Trachymyrmex septentrionalis]